MKVRLFLGISFLLCFSVSCRNAAVADGYAADSLYLFAGSYQASDEGGVAVFRFHQGNGSCRLLTTMRGISHPSYVLPDTSHTVWAVAEDEGETAALYALRFDARRNTLSVLNHEKTAGGAPCHIAYNPYGGFLLTANYMGGSLSLFRLHADGSLAGKAEPVKFAGSGPVKERQEASHIHFAAFSPDATRLWVNDLGADVVRCFEIDYPHGGFARPVFDMEEDISLAPGDGPRHLDIAPNRKYVYLLAELSGDVIGFRLEEGRLHPFLRQKADTTGAAGSADVHVSPDGRFLYTSHRLKNDGIAIFAIDAAGGLKKVGYQPTGLHPRNFVITPNGKYLLVACRDSHEIQIFARDVTTGLLTLKGSVPMKKVSSVRFSP